jgi:hypothetical protein
LQVLLLLIMTVGGVMYMHTYKLGGLYTFFWCFKSYICFSFMVA